MASPRLPEKCERCNAKIGGFIVEARLQGYWCYLCGSGHIFQVETNKNGRADVYLGTGMENYAVHDIYYFGEPPTDVKDELVAKGYKLEFIDASQEPITNEWDHGIYGNERESLFCDIQMNSPDNTATVVWKKIKKS